MLVQLGVEVRIRDFVYDVNAHAGEHLSREERTKSPMEEVGERLAVGVKRFVKTADPACGECDELREVFATDVHRCL